MSTHAPSQAAAVPDAAPTAACLNCGAGVGGAFCGRCGQPADTRRFTVPRLLRDSASSVLSFDSATLRTARALATRPGTFTRAYLGGQRQGYLSPVRYYLLAVALNVAAAALPGAAGDAPRGAGSFWDENFVALQIGAVFALLALPVSVAQHRLLHRRAGYTLAEHYAFALYALAQGLLVVVALRLGLWQAGRALGGDLDGAVWLAAFTLHSAWAGRAFFGEPAWRVALKLLAAYAIVVVAGGAAAWAAVALAGVP